MTPTPRPPERRDGSRQRDLFDTAGISDVASKAIRAAILECCSTHECFTSDMVLDRLSFLVRDELRAHPNAIGAAITQSAKANLIEHTGQYVKSQRDTRRKGRVAVWRRRRAA